MKPKSTSTTTMLGCFMILLMTTLFQMSHGNPRIKCSASDASLNFTIIDTGNTANKLETFAVSSKTSTPRDPWVKQDDCKRADNVSNKIQCSGNRRNNAQNFKIDWAYKEDNNGNITKRVEEVWFYNCFDKHGVRTISAASHRWNEFVVRWKHYKTDQNFIKKDMIKVVDVKTGEFLQLHRENEKDDINVYKHKNAQGGVTYNVCIWTIFYGSLDSNLTLPQFEKTTDEKCVNVTTPAKPPPENSSTDLKAPLLAVGIGILCLILICVMFVVYNKKCKQGGDHDYDMNKDETLIGDEAKNSVSMQQYNNDDGEKENLNQEDVDKPDDEK